MSDLNADFEVNTGPDAPQEPSTEGCGNCGADASALMIFPGFGGAPDVGYCMVCGAFREGEGPWVPPNF